MLDDVSSPSMYNMRPAPCVLSVSIMGAECCDSGMPATAHVSTMAKKARLLVTNMAFSFVCVSPVVATGDDAAGDDATSEDGEGGEDGVVRVVGESPAEDAGDRGAVARSRSCW